MYFELDYHGNLESGRCLPLYRRGDRDSLELCGGFTVKRGDKIGFYASRESWLGLMVEGDHKFYFRPIYNEQSLTVGGILEEAKSSPESIEIRASEVTDVEG